MQHKQCDEHSHKVINQNRRRKYVINSAFQWKYALTMSLGVFLCTSIMSCVLYTILHEQARQRFLHPSEYAASVGTIVLFTAFAFSVLTGGAMGIWCVIVTHRVCGPLFILERHFSELVGGRLPKVRALRRKDEFKELFAGFSRAVQTLRRDKQNQLSTLSDVLDKARECSDADEQTCKQALESIAAQVDRLRQETADALGEDVVERSPCECDPGSECRGVHHSKEKAPARVA